MSQVLVSEFKIMKYIYLNVFQQVEDDEDSEIIVIDDSDVEEVVEEAADSDDSTVAQAGSENEAMNQ